MSEVDYFNWNVLIPLWPLKMLSPGEDFVKVSFLLEFPKFMLVGRKYYVMAVLWKQYYFCIITTKYASILSAIPALVKGNKAFTCTIFFFPRKTWTNVNKQNWDGYHP